MKTIGILVPGLSGGGAEFVARQWANYLSGRGWEVIVFATHSSAAEIDGLEVVRVEGSGFIARTRYLSRLLRDRQVDVLIALMPHWNIMGLLAAIGTRTHVIVSGRNVESGLQQAHGLKLRVEMLVARLLYRRADAYIAISHPVGTEAIEKYRLRSERVWVVPNPATAKVDLQAARDRRAVLSQSREDSRELALVIPARIVRQKRPLLAIDVSEELVRRGWTIGVHYFGDGPLKSDVEARAVHSAVPVVFHGWVEHWFEHCPTKSVVFLPSVSEGFGNVLVEAAAVGVASVVPSRAFGVADAVAPGITGEFAIDGSVSAFADAVERSAQIRIGDIDAWLDHFSYERSGAELERVLASMRDRS